MMKLTRQTALILALSTSLVAGGAAAVAEAADPARLTLTGEGQVTATPDMATVTLGVIAEHSEAQEAARLMSEQAGAVLARLEAEGIAATDVQTTGLSLDPRWQERKDVRDGVPEIGTFVASTDVSIRVRDLDRLGGLLDAVVRDGANTLRGISFGLQDPQPLQDKARVAAVADARRRAGLLADAAGVRLGNIRSIDDSGGMQPRMMRAEMNFAAADAGMPVAAGELSLSARVTISWDLLPDAE